jgi:RNA polymerase sigma-70 factor (ECF subfamily)
MDLPSNSLTSTTLLLRLRQSPSDQAAWAEFVERYGQQIEGWCRQWGLQDADAQDVAQTVLLKLLRAAQTFRYDPEHKFRAWLKTVTHHAWRDWVRSRRRIAGNGDHLQDDPLRQVAARDDLADRMPSA